MIFHTLISQGPEGSVENPGQSPKFSTLPEGPLKDKIMFDFDLYYWLESTKLLPKNKLYFTTTFSYASMLQTGFNFQTGFEKPGY